MNWSSRGILVRQCMTAQKHAIREHMLGNRGPYRTKNDILSYYSHCPFYAFDLTDCIYSNKTAALNSLATEGTLLKLHPGPGYRAHYTFPAEVMVELVGDVEKENNK